MTESSAIVLLVEGDILLRHPLAQYLRECGFVVYEAADGEEARAVVREHGRAIEVVLADAATAGAGFELRSWILAQGFGIDVVLVGSVEKAVNAAGTLCNDGPALVKPYEHKLVLTRIRQQLARRSRIALNE